jgi:putative ABC transport system substrate-binding protein
MLWNVNDLGMTLRYQGAADAARTIGVRVQPLGVREPEDFDEAFASMLRDPPDAILMVSDALTRLNRRRVYEFAAEHRLPTTYERANYVREGGLSAYGPDLDEIYDRATYLIASLREPIRRTYHSSNLRVSTSASISRQLRRLA